MKLFFIGLWFLLFDYAVRIGAGVVNLLPPFVGFFLWFLATKKVYIYSSWFLKLRYGSFAMTFISLAIWIKDLFSYPENPSMADNIIAAVTTILNLAMLWLLIKSFAGMAERRRIPGAFPLVRGMRYTWWIMVLCDVGVYFFEIVPVFAWICLFGGILAAIVLLCFVWSAQKLLDKKDG